MPMFFYFRISPETNMVANEGTIYTAVASQVSTGPQIGVVAAISGAKVTCQLGEPSEKNSVPLLIGSVVKIPTGRSLVFGLVTHLARPIFESANTTEKHAAAEVDLIGEMVQQGINYS